MGVYERIIRTPSGVRRRRRMCWPIGNARVCAGCCSEKVRRMVLCVIATLEMSGAGSQPVLVGERKVGARVDVKAGVGVAGLVSCARAEGERVPM